jgi:hypothetical protein
LQFIEEKKKQVEECNGELSYMKIKTIEGQSIKQKKWTTTEEYIHKK